MRKTEAYHHTPEQVKGYADEACKIADKLGLDDGDRAALLPVIFTQLSSKQIWYEQVSATGILNGLPQMGRR